ncbi:MAG: flavodoxin family protein [Methanotrichaceae archaeon]
MPKVLVVYHSRSGNTAKMADAIAQGVRNAGLEAILKKSKDASLEDLTESDGIIFGTPTYFGSLSAEMKSFIDQSVKVRGNLEGKVGAAFTSSGSTSGGNETTLLSMIQAMLIHGMIILGDPIETGGHYGAVAIGRPDEDALRTCTKLGERVGNLVKKLIAD